MKLTLKELNEIYYCLSKVLDSNEPNLADKESITALKTKIWDEIDMIEYESQNNDDDEDLGPEYDSAGFTEDDRIVNGQYRVIPGEVENNDGWEDEDGDY